MRSGCEMRTPATSASAVFAFFARAGEAFLAGALTPAAAGLGGTLVAALVFVSAPGTGGGLLLVTVAALGLLGPGAYSVDARLFGRREIQVPRRADTPDAVAKEPENA